MELNESQMGFHYAIEATETTIRVRLSGWMGYETLEQLQDCWKVVREQIRPLVVLDLAEVTCLASGPLGSILALRRWLEGHGSRLEISAASDDVREIMKSARLNALLPSKDEADPAAT